MPDLCAVSIQQLVLSICMNSSQHDGFQSEAKQPGNQEGHLAAV